MVSTPYGILSESNPLTQLNAELPIVLIPRGINDFLHPEINLLVLVSIIALQFSRES